MKFKGTVIVIDPVHVSLSDDWEGTFDTGRGIYTPPIGTNLTDVLFGTTEMYSAKCKWDFYKPGENGELVRFSSYKSSSNSIGVFYLDEVYVYNPDFAEILKNLVEGEDYTIFKDFEGDIDTKIALCDPKEDDDEDYDDNFDYDIDDDDYDYEDDDYYDDDEEEEEAFGGFAPYLADISGNYIAIPKLVEETH